VGGGGPARGLLGGARTMNAYLEKKRVLSYRRKRIPDPQRRQTSDSPRKKKKDSYHEEAEKANCVGPPGPAIKKDEVIARRKIWEEKATTETCLRKRKKNVFLKRKKFK